MIVGRAISIQDSNSELAVNCYGVASSAITTMNVISGWLINFCSNSIGTATMLGINSGNYTDYNTYLTTVKKAASRLFTVNDGGKIKIHTNPSISHAYSPLNIMSYSNGRSSKRYDVQTQFVEAHAPNLNWNQASELTLYADPNKINSHKYTNPVFQGVKQTSEWEEDKLIYYPPSTVVLLSYDVFSGKTATQELYNYYFSSITTHSKCFLPHEVP